MSEQAGRSPDIAERVPLLATKLFVPRVPEVLTPRPRLAGRLHDLLKHPLTVISAPAGFGKTTLIAAWHRSASGRDLPLAWLCLEEADNDPARYWSYLVAALQREQPHLGNEVLPMLRSPQPLPAPVVLTSLINDLAALGRELVLVLDDYHAIVSPSIQEAMAYLVEHLPPGIHLVILTRVDPPWPLARWRARGVCAEIRGADLRFTTEETAAFVGQTAELELSVGDSATLQARTEGWIAGLQMAALSLRGRKDVSTFIQSFAGTNRFVLDFLAEEVLSREEEAVQSFLLRTCILERLCAPLCEALVEGDGSQESQVGDDILNPHPLALNPHSGQAMLERLERANLFVVPLDDERKWYRYHHLFAEVLLNQLRRSSPDLVPVLHRRAGGWYERHGLVDQAFHHAVEARDWSAAARLVVNNWMPVGHSGQAATVLRWLDALPDELVRDHAILSMASAWILWLNGTALEVEAHLDNAGRALAGSRPSAGAEEWQLAVIPSGVAALRSHLALQRGDVEAARHFGEEALALAPPQAPLVQGHGYAALAHARRESGETAGCIEALRQGIPLLRAGGNSFGAATAAWSLARVLRLSGRLREAFSVCDEAMRHAGQAGGAAMPGTAMVNLAMGELLLEQGRLDEAMEQLLPVAMLARHSALVAVSLNHGVTLARLRRAQGDVEGALAAIHDAERLVPEEDMPLSAAELSAHAATIHLAAGDLVEAVRWAEQAARRAGDDRGRTRTIEMLAVVRVWQAQGRHSEAAEALTRRLVAAETQGLFGEAIEILVLRSLAWEGLHRRGEALSDLGRALEFAAPEGYVRVFLDEGDSLARLLRAVSGQPSAISGRARDYAARLLDAIPAISPQPSAVSRPRPVPTSPSVLNAQHPLAEPLSDRELEVLRLISEGYSNQEIAARLVVSLNTVKKHSSNVFGKLGVASRTQAVARARDLGLF